MSSPALQRLVGLGLGGLIALLGLALFVVTAAGEWKSRRRTPAAPPPPPIFQDPEAIRALLPEYARQAELDLEQPLAYPARIASLGLPDLPNLGALLEGTREVMRSLAPDQRAALHVAALLELRSGGTLLSRFLLAWSGALALTGLTVALAPLGVQILAGVAMSLVLLGGALLHSLPHRFPGRRGEDPDYLVAQALADPLRMLEALARLEEMERDLDRRRRAHRLQSYGARFGELSLPRPNHNGERRRRLAARLGR